MLEFSRLCTILCTLYAVNSHDSQCDTGKLVHDVRCAQVFAFFIGLEVGITPYSCGILSVAKNLAKFFEV